MKWPTWQRAIDCSLWLKWPCWAAKYCSIRWIHGFSKREREREETCLFKIELSHHEIFHSIYILKWIRSWWKFVFTKQVGLFWWSTIIIRTDVIYGFPSILVMYHWKSIVFGSDMRMYNHYERGIECFPSNLRKMKRKTKIKTTCFKELGMISFWQHILCNSNTLP